MLFSTQPKKEVSDSQLITNYKNFHDISSLGILFQRYSYLVFCICQKYLKNEEDSKDAVMDIYDKLAEDLKQYNISNFKSWLYTVTKNHCLMKLRRDTRENTVLRNIDQNNKEIHRKNPDPSDQSNDGDIQMYELGMALKQLNNMQKECIELFYFEKKSYKEITKTTDYAMNQVKSHIQNGRRNLRNILT